MRATPIWGAADGGRTPGDVWAVNAAGPGRWFIELGARLAGNPAPVDHVVVVSHRDKRGVLWGIEGRPSGCGPVLMKQYLHGPFARAANSNAAQPRTDAQRRAVVRLMQGLTGTGYDWIGGILADFDHAVGAGELARLVDHWWGWQDGTARPPHVVCSSAAAWAYGRLGLDHPGGEPEEMVTPADWWHFNQRWK